RSPVTVRIVRLASAAVAAEAQGAAIAPPALHSKSHTETTKALSHFSSLTPIQRMSIRDYVGESKNDVQEMNFNGKEILILRNSKSHEYVGEVAISPAADGNVTVTKLTGNVTLDTKHSVEIPLSSRATEEA